ncbi:MAG: DUF917 domain-containing protein [Gaiellaceae bacterium]
MRDIARGAAVLGTGGGGDPYLGTLAALAALEEYGSPEIIEAHEVPEDGLVALPVMVGAPVAFLEKFPIGRELEFAYRALDNYLEGGLVALMSAEMGGANSVVPLILGARLGVPVVDADGMGRAYPEVQLVTLTLYGIKASPFALADEHGNTVVINTIDNVWTERLARPAAVEFGAISASMGYPLTGKQLREAAVIGTLTWAEHIGAAIREAREQKTDAIAALLHVTNGFELFRGKIVDVQRRTERGWSVGEAVLEGLDEFSGSSMTVRFQNENLVAIRDGDVIASVPDLITLIDAETGEPITTERLRYGFRSIVLGIPCDEKWRTEAGVELGGPRHFGYEIDYVPLEALNAAPTVGTRE